MNEPIHTTEYKNLTINIYHQIDESGHFSENLTNPKPFHTYGRWNRSSLFEHEGSGADWLQHIFTQYHDEIVKKYKSLSYSDCFTDYDYHDLGKGTPTLEKAEQLVQNWIDSELIVLPLYVYEHNSIIMRAGSGFSSSWDSGQAGYIYMSKKEARENYMTKKVNVAKIKEAMKSCVEYLTAICEGSIYGFVIEDENGEHLDSCWGFVETEYPIEKTHVYSEALESAKYIYKDLLKKHIEHKKALIKNHVPLLARD